MIKEYCKVIYYNGLSIVALNYKYGAIDGDGLLVIPCVYNVFLDVITAIDKYIRNQNRIEKLKTLI